MKYFYLLFCYFLLIPTFSQQRKCEVFWQHVQDEDKKGEPDFVFILKQLNAYKLCDPTKTRMANNKIEEINSRILAQRDSARKERNRATALYWASTIDKLIPAHQLQVLLRADKLHPNLQIIQQKIEQIFRDTTTYLFKEKLMFDLDLYNNHNKFVMSKNDSFLYFDDRNSRRLFLLPKFKEITQSFKSKGFYFSKNRDILIKVNPNNVYEFIDLKYHNLDKKINLDTNFTHKSDKILQIFLSQDSRVAIIEGIGNDSHFYIFLNNGNEFKLLKSYVTSNDPLINEQNIIATKQQLGKDSSTYYSLLEEIHNNKFNNDWLQNDSLSIRRYSATIQTSNNLTEIKILNIENQRLITKFSFKNTINEAIDGVFVSNSNRYLICRFKQADDWNLMEFGYKYRIFDLEQGSLPSFQQFESILGHSIIGTSFNGRYIWSYDKIWEVKGDSLKLISLGRINTFHFPYFSIGTNGNRILNLSNYNGIYPIIDTTSDINKIVISRESDYLLSYHSGTSKVILSNFYGDSIFNIPLRNTISNLGFSNNGEFAFYQNNGYYKSGLNGEIIYNHPSHKILNIKNNQIDSISTEVRSNNSAIAWIPEYTNINDSLICLNFTNHTRDSIIVLNYKTLKPYMTFRKVCFNSSGILGICTNGRLTFTNQTSKIEYTPSRKDFNRLDIYGDSLIILKKFDKVSQRNQELELLVLSKTKIKKAGFLKNLSPIEKVITSKTGKYLITVHTKEGAMIWKKYSETFIKMPLNIKGLINAYFDDTEKFICWHSNSKIVIQNLSTNEFSIFFTNQKINYIDAFFCNSNTVYLFYNRFFFNIHINKFLNKEVLLDDHITSRLDNIERKELQLNYSQIQNWFRKFNTLLSPLTTPLEQMYNLNLKYDNK
ncbi:hypothetical protein [Runella limosa]|uniref:hypothetical protein n=1 Tax=Runella limosa TaxID=370978 RepID=UPI0004099085|nr:hypothetical protein [Runella limosa]